MPRVKRRGAKGRYEMTGNLLHEAISVAGWENYWGGALEGEKALGSPQGSIRV